MTFDDASNELSRNPPLHLHGGEPVWFDGVQQPEWAPLRSKVKTDVVVIGAGISGLLTALELVDAGKRVVVLEARRVAKGVTGRTTAKVSVAQGGIYEQLGDNDLARSYAGANHFGVGRLRALAKKFAPDAWNDLPCVLLAEASKDLESLAAEVEAMRAAGIPVEWPAEHGLPSVQSGAAVVPGQGQIQPYALLTALAAELVKRGAVIHERSPVLQLEEESDGVVVTTDTGRVQATAAVLACHMPFPIRGFIFAKAFPYMGYAVALRVPEERMVDAMHVSLAAEGHALRFTQQPDGTPLAIFSGEGHKVGEISETQERYRRLVDWGTGVLKLSGDPDIARCWSTHDIRSADHIPYAGQLSRTSSRVYVTTGYGGWGMANAAAAAHAVAELLLEREAPWENIMDPLRLSRNKRGFMELAKENVKVAARYAKDPLQGSSDTLPSSLAPGEGALLKLEGGRRVAAARDLTGELHVVSPRCTHLGCLVNFNEGDRTWDCPCHGSRFAIDGKVLYGPATDDLRQLALTPEEAAGEKPVPAADRSSE